MPTLFRDVRFQGQSGKHLLALSAQHVTLLKSCDGGAMSWVSSTATNWLIEATSIEVASLFCGGAPKSWAVPAAQMISSTLTLPVRQLSDLSPGPVWKLAPQKSGRGFSFHEFFVAA